MGRERSRTRQYLYFCAAGLILSLFTACAPVAIKLPEQEDAHLRSGQHLFARGDFEGALREYREVLARSRQNHLGDEALFNMGLIYIHQANPKRDIGQAQIFFARLEKEFPESPHKEEAKIWIGILETMKKTSQQDLEDEEKKKMVLEEQEDADLRRGQHLLAQGDFEGALRANQEVLVRFPQRPPGDEALFTMGLIHVHYANPKRDIGQAQAFFSRLEKEFPESPRTEEAKIWIDILDTMEKTRQIDIEIEEKKRELRR